ncbi:hypothetical protein [Candidatus Methanoperedens nitratireducens]|uniref:Uncharacterized protein n=1 Tax=Candidatus Methanoperedens nitratireducens TaxID=1392998 RepID=A0A284VP02_9EURY|nr:hypothetical protein [Candidatus Methanoperedens nitroreducens]SNQ61026.1 conserved hypothetical protein [Candidatus Methanoperedens nitroreducens]
MKRLFGIKSNKDFDSTIKDIKQLNDLLLHKLTYSPQNITIRTLETEKQGISTNVGLESAGVSAAVSSDQEIEKKAELVGVTLSHENAAEFIREFFKQLKIMLGLSYSLVLIDECSEASKEGQIEVFRLLKLIRGAAGADIQQNYLYFVAAVYPPEATYYPSKLHGDSFNFELGNDASVDYLQLDENLEEYESFFSALTEKRLRYLGGNGFGVGGRGTIDDIFDSDKAFTIAAYTANGIPRRYIEILKQAYDNLHQRAIGIKEQGQIIKISVRDIESAVQTVVSNNILVQNKLTDKEFKLLDELVNKLGRRNRKQETENKGKEKPVPAIVYFTMSRSQILEISNLITQGAIHDKGRTRVRKFYRDEALQGELMSLDLAVAFHNGAINKTRAAEIFKKDLKENAKSGYEWCSDFNLSKFKALKKSDTAV